MSGLNSEGSSQRSASVEEHEDPNQSEDRSRSSLAKNPIIFTEVFDDKSEPTHAGMKTHTNIYFLEHETN